jgi:hypothetical protein
MSQFLVFNLKSKIGGDENMVSRMRKHYKHCSLALAVSFAFVFAVPARAGTFIDDFGDGNLDGWIQGHPFGAMKWRIIDGEVVISDQSEIGTWIATGE